MSLIIKQLPPESWSLYRDLRLAATKTDPQAFAATYQEELERTQDQWCSFLPNMWFAMNNNQAVGMIGLLQDTGTAGQHRAHLISLWVDPAYRGHGVGKKLTQHLQKLAPERGIRKIYLHVTTTQTEAIKLYTSLGFRIVGTLQENTKSGTLYLDQLLMEWHIVTPDHTGIG